MLLELDDNMWTMQQNDNFHPKRGVEFV